MSSQSARLPLVKLPSLEERLPFLKEVVIFGAGSLGRQARKLLEQHDVGVRAFVDNNVHSHGSLVEGIEVIGPARLGELDAPPVVIASLWADQIWAQVWELGVRDVSIYWGAATPLAAGGCEVAPESASWHLEDSLAPSRRLILRDLVRPGQTVFDVGSYHGAVARLLSRLVGPNGTVCAFEASSRSIAACQAFLAANGCANTQLYHAAVRETSNRVAAVYPGADDSGDSLWAKGPTAAFDEAPAVSLDEFAALFDLHPSLVHIDAEGSEARVIGGARRVLAEDRPHVVAAVRNDRPQLVSRLLTEGYRGWFADTYDQVRGPSDLERRPRQADLVFVHESRLGQSPFHAGLTRLALAAFDVKAITVENDALGLPSIVVPDACRAVLSLCLAADRPQRVMVEVSRDARVCGRATCECGATLASIDIPVHVEAGSRVGCTLRGVDGVEPEPGIVRSATLYRVTGLTASLPAWLR